MIIGFSKKIFDVLCVFVEYLFAVWYNLFVTLKLCMKRGYINVY